MGLGREECEESCLQCCEFGPTVSREIACVPLSLTMLDLLQTSQNPASLTSMLIAISMPYTPRPQAPPQLPFKHDSRVCMSPLVKGSWGVLVYHPCATRARSSEELASQVLRQTLATATPPLFTSTLQPNAQNSKSLCVGPPRTP